jgi:type VI protein secretion system component Hcp
MTISQYIVVVGIFIMVPLISSSQKVGVGTSTPSEKLEVQGKVFSTQGGFKFPDGTVQSTAADNVNPESAAVFKLYGVMEMTNIVGAFDSLGFTEGIRVIDLDFLTTIPTAGGGGGGGAADPTFVHFRVVAEIEKSTPKIFDNLANGSTIVQVLVHLLDDAANVYFIIGMENVKIDSLNTRIVHVGNGDYAHVVDIGLLAPRVSLDDIGSGICFCWDYMTASPCNCIN